MYDLSLNYQSFQIPVNDHNEMLSSPIRPNDPRGQLILRLSTSLGNLWICTGKLVGKPVGQLTCGSRSPGGTGLHRSRYDI